MPLPAEPEPLAVMDSGRDLDRERPLFDHASCAVALRTRLLDPPAGACAVGAGLGADELAEDAPRDLLEATRAAACGAGRDGRPRLGATSVATRARNGDLERNLA